MLISEYEFCLQGERDEQLDRFQVADTGKCTLFLMADGFTQCDARPHYVDWLTTQVARLDGSDLDAEAVCKALNNLLCTQEVSPGKASVAIVISDDNHHYFATLGDTRIYWLTRRDRTRDHSLAERCVIRGHCPPEALRHHPLRNRLTAWAGSSSAAIIPLTWRSAPLLEDEHLLVCTDGYWSQLSEDEIYATGSSSALRKQCEQLNADERRLPDNLTVALLMRTHSH
jgi:PPM family protein phosphatase